VGSLNTKQPQLLKLLLLLVRTSQQQPAAVSRRFTTDDIAIITHTHYKKFSGISSVTKPRPSVSISTGPILQLGRNEKQSMTTVCRLAN